MRRIVAATLAPTPAEAGAQSGDGATASLRLSQLGPGLRRGGVGVALGSVAPGVTSHRVAHHQRLGVPASAGTTGWVIAADGRPHTSTTPAEAGAQLGDGATASPRLSQLGPGLRRGGVGAYCTRRDVAPGCATSATLGSRLRRNDGVGDYGGSSPPHSHPPRRRPGPSRGTVRLHRRGFPSRAPAFAGVALRPIAPGATPHRVAHHQRLWVPASAGTTGCATSAALSF